MMRLILLLLFLIPAFAHSYTEYAVLDPKLKKAALRAEPNNKAKVVLTILPGDFMQYANLSAEEDWASVYVYRKGKWIEGYLPSKSVTMIENLPHVPKKDVSFQYTSQPFSKEGKKLTYNEDGHLEKIDGHEVLGSNGGVPGSEVTAATLTYKGKKYEVPAKLLKGLYDANNEGLLYLSHHGRVIVQSNNSDGGESYTVLWILQKDGTLNRFP